MNTPILLTGGTCGIGSHVLGRLRAAGEGVRILSRHPRANELGIEHVPGDTVAGTGLAAALDGVDTVLHLARGAKGDDIAARHLADAARRAGTGHLILISVVGADSMPIGCFRTKAAAAEAIAGSGVPWTALRAAQLHDFVLPVVQVLARMPLVLVPGGLRFEPVQVHEVAARLAELALGDPAGRVADVVGPEVLDVQKLLEDYWDVFGHRRLRLPLRIPGAIGRAYRDGKNLAVSGAQRGVVSWTEFLAEQVTTSNQASAHSQNRSTRLPGWTAATSAGSLVHAPVFSALPALAPGTLTS